MMMVRVEVRFTGIKVSEAEAILDKMPVKPKLTANGLWQVVNDCDADSVVIDGKYYWSSTRRRAPSELEKYEYAVKLITPLFDTRSIVGLMELKRLMNQLFEAGAVVTSTDCVKVHFLRGYSERLTGKILKLILQSNKLLYTALFFPNLFAPLCLLMRYRFDEENDKFKGLRAEIYKNYRQIIEGLVASDTKHLIEKMLWELMRDKMHPRFYEQDYAYLSSAKNDVGNTKMDGIPPAR